MVLKAPLATAEDLQLIKEYILLPVLLDVLERDIAMLERTKLKMIVIYTAYLKHIQNQVIGELTLKRKEMRELGIKVYSQQRTSICIEADYLCRGYHHKFSMLWSLVKAELEMKLSTLFDFECR